MAWAATHTKGSYFKGPYRRLAHRPGKPRALVAVAHTLVPVIYPLLRQLNLEYRELGEEYLDNRDAEQTATHLTKRLEKLGYEVTLKARRHSPTKGFQERARLRAEPVRASGERDLVAGQHPGASQARPDQNHCGGAFVDH